LSLPQPCPEVTGIEAVELLNRIAIPKEVQRTVSERS
jgi:hypothetical protein